MDLLLLTTKLRLSLPIQNLQQFKFTQTHQNLRTSPNLPNNPNLEQTQQIHAHFIKTQFNNNHQVPLNFLKPHLSPEAKYNFLITSYINNNHPENALSIYAQMRRIDTQVDNFTLPSVLKACGQVSCINLGKEIHGFVVKNGFSTDVYVSNALIQMYGECGSLVFACLMFDKMPGRDVVSWSTMIGIYSRRRLIKDAIAILREMHLLGVKLSEVAMTSLVNVIADFSNMKMGKEMHGYITRNVSNEKMIVPIITALIDMYSKCGNLSSARSLFIGLTDKSIVAWTAIITGYIRYNKLEEGIELFVRMLEDSIVPNEIMMLSLITECGFVGAQTFGKWLHAHVLRNGFGMSLALATALISMYGKRGEIRYARVIFDTIENKDVKIWSAMISAYARVSSIDQAVNLFVKMRDSGIRPNRVTTVGLLSLCAELGALDLGRWIHAYIDNQRVGIDIILNTALIDMYAKCGDIDTAQKLFDEATERDTGMYNAMIAGLAMHGCGKEALQLFLEMEKQGIEPNDITFIGVFNACSHAGLVSEGKRHFEKMVHGFGLVPKIEHYGCMVDLLGRAGHLDGALNIIKNMPIQSNTVIWGALLGACKLHNDLKLAEVAARKILELEPENCGYIVLISNVYAAANRWNEVDKVRKKMKSMGIKKEPGLSSIEVNGSVHDFIMGDKTHPQVEKVYEMVAEMSEKLKDAGYKPNTSVVLQNIHEEEKETALNYHSEKLAMAFGLISTNGGTPIRIVKNLRVCEDCHTATKMLSKIYRRTIIVRDRKRFHRFVEGSCSCNDYW